MLIQPLLNETTNMTLSHFVFLWHYCSFSLTSSFSLVSVEVEVGGCFLEDFVSLISLIVGGLDATSCEEPRTVSFL